MKIVNKEKCPLCGFKLYKKHEGLVCTNHKCKLHSSDKHKMGKSEIK